MLMKLISLLQKKPTDKTIRIWRILFWMFYIWIMYYNLFYLTWKWISDTYFFWQLTLSKDQVEILKYFFTSIWIVPIFIWITNICLLPKKYIRYVQILFGIFLFYIASSINASPNLDFDVIIWLMWVVPLIAWITWKCITSKCMKYKEKITKIRV